MTPADYYFSDPRVVLVPIEHLSAGGISRAGAALLAARGNWSRARIALLDTAFALYWSRTAALAGRMRTWAPPRTRHIAVLRDALAVHPYAQLLNTSAWTLYDTDFDPERSHPEFVAYLLAHGDRMAQTGEVTHAALFNAAWWFTRSDDECAAFAAAAAATARPDGAAFQVLAEALPWLRQLGLGTRRPTAPGARSIPGSELLVPVEHVDAPQQLVDRWTAIARTAVDAFLTAWRTPDRDAEHRLIDWLVSAAPAVLITARGGDALWDPAAPDRVERLRAELDCASGAAVRDVHADLAVLDRHTRRFRAALVDAVALPAPAPTTEQRGYTFMHRTRRLLAYDFDEAGIDRRHAPALPFARAMLGARAAHEWAHLAVGAGWVPLIVSATELGHRVGVLAEQFDAAIAAAPESVRRATAADLGALRAAAALPAGAALARVLLSRMSDFQANGWRNGT